MRNVLLIVIDCLGQLFVHGNKRRVYPFLDSLFSRGLSVTQCVSVSTTTSPSVASILTGTYPINHGITTLAGATLDTRAPCLAEVLGSFGYRTYAEVTGPLYPDLGIDRGFLNYNYREKGQYLGSEWGEELCKRMRSGEFRRPWFLLLHLWELHQPRWSPFKPGGGKRVSFESALRWLDRAMENTLGSCLDMDNTILILTGDHGERVERNHLDKLLRVALVRGYEKFHERLGFPARWKARVDRHLRLGHGFHLMEDLIRVPLLILDKDRLPRGLELNMQASNVDIFPILLGLLGIQYEDERLDGTDILGLWMKKISMSDHRAFLYASGVVLPDPEHHLEGLRWKGLKYIRQRGAKEREAQWLYKVDEGFRERPLRDDHTCSLMREEIERLHRSAWTDGTGRSMSQEESEAIARRLRDLGYL